MDRFLKHFYQNALVVKVKALRQDFIIHSFCSVFGFLFLCIGDVEGGLS